MAQFVFAPVIPFDDGGDDPPDDRWFNPLHQSELSPLVALRRQVLSPDRP